MSRYFFLLFCLVLTITVITLAAGEVTNKRLADLLAPRGGAGIVPSQPAAAPAPREPRIPALAQRKFPDAPPRPEFVSLKTIHPHMSQEPAPLLAYFAAPVVPVETVLPTTALVAIPELVDVNKPQPLPILSPTPTSDRPSLADATLEASVAVTMSKSIPSRATPVPFVAMNLPDPFENQQYIRLPNPPPEEGPLLTIPAPILVVPPPAPPAPKK